MKNDLLILGAVAAGLYLINNTNSVSNNPTIKAISEQIELATGKISQSTLDYRAYGAEILEGINGREILDAAKNHGGLGLFQANPDAYISNGGVKYYYKDLLRLNDQYQVF
jgi:hypothetical protein